MITQWFLNFWHGLAVSLFSWLHGALPAPPSWVADLASGITTVFAMVPASVRYFVPLGPVVTIGTTFVGLLVAVGLLRVARRTLSLFTGGGGNA